MRCRHCDAELSLRFLDLGSAPPSNAYLSRAQVSAPETWFPLCLLVCTRCWLVQSADYAGREVFTCGAVGYMNAGRRPISCRSFKSDRGAHPGFAVARVVFHLAIAGYIDGSLLGEHERKRT